MKRWIAIVLVTLFTLYLGVTLFFADREHGNVVCTGLEVRVSEVEMNSLIDTATISKMIKREFGELIGSPIAVIDTDTIVTFLHSLDQVKEAGVYFSQNGRMYIALKQHNPLFRVLPNSGNPYAIDEYGRVMTIRGVAPFRSIVVTGKVTKEMAMGEIRELVLFINDDHFWSAMFEQIDVDSRGEYILIPKIADFKVRLGDLSDLETKMENLRLYLEQGTEQRGWDLYKEINLKFRNQVIGVKK
ncbi:MAG: hypothetical protein J6K74_06715 [Marinifilaceae bacterium]|nr:hypothetical protein [Marinifilaceae bacterium]